MYYYKSFYLDGTYDLIKSKTPIRKASTICTTCYRVEVISAFEYYSEQIKAFVQYNILYTEKRR